VFRRSPRRAGERSISIVNIDGSGLSTVQQYNSGTFNNPKWSPVALGDEQEAKMKILYSDKDDGKSTRDLFVTNVDGSGSKVMLTNTTEPWQPIDAEWSQDGSQIAAVLWNNETGERVLRIYDIDCSSTCTLTDSTNIDNAAEFGASTPIHGLDWANTQDKLVLRVGSFDGPGLYILDLSSTPSFYPLFHASGEKEMHPSWSSDDSEIAFISFTVGGVNKRVLAIGADGNDLREIARPKGLTSSGLDWR